ncbi:MAG: hypothetical protein K8S56_06285 [Candidatus Cloacimonetes bacterium]|nr:hypothetical protein [Candidatus Cloacimonadota bacterium]
METSPGPVGKKIPLRIDQANVFYNYAIGFEATSIDLVGTAKKLLELGIAKAVFFSDLKFLYTDADGEVQIELMQPQGRQWDSGWKIQFDSKVPAAVATEIILSTEVSFHENRIEGPEPRQISPYLRAIFPPIVLESDELQLPLFTSIKLFANGIAILSFQLDTTWDGVEEDYFVSNVVNLYQYYFSSIWVDSRIQRLDAETIMPVAFQDKISIAGNPLGGRKVNKILRKMRMESRALLNKDLGKQGRQFEIGNEHWTLHQIAGSKEQDSWESTLDLCRSEYFNTLSALLVLGREQRKLKARSVYLWQGRPSITLMRFRGQPATKDDLLSTLAPSLSRILMRSTAMDNPPDLPPDLRPFGDYCFHGNRALLLWTWLLPHGAPANAWDESVTRAVLLEHQARSEHIEYHNMQTARACAIAQSPPSDNHLMEAYEILSSFHDVTHHSSQAGEISDALTYLLEVIGTAKLVAPAKEAARWYLDELRYRSDKRRIRSDRWLSFVFGIVGTAGLADFAIKPNLVAAWPGLSPELTPLVALGIAGLIIVLIAIPIWYFKIGESGD